MKLQPLTREDCETARHWRNECLETLRTPYFLTEEMQSDFYGNVICNRNSPHRYWGVYEDGCDATIGLVGVTDIGWENSIAEISLIVNPQYQKKGFGVKAVELLLDKAFNQMGLKTVFGECYEVNLNGVAFWKKIVTRYKGSTAVLPSRKFWDGKFWDSYYFSIDRKDFK